jgi:hypothetical protein
MLAMSEKTYPANILGRYAEGGDVTVPLTHAYLGDPTLGYSRASREFTTRQRQLSYSPTTLKGQLCPHHIGDISERTANER